MLPPCIHPHPSLRFCTPTQSSLFSSDTATPAAYHPHAPAVSSGFTSNTATTCLPSLTHPNTSKIASMLLPHVHLHPSLRFCTPTAPSQFPSNASTPYLLSPILMLPHPHLILILLLFSLYLPLKLPPHVCPPPHILPCLRPRKTLKIWV
ncbi:hypothetical protein O181_033138 [Austropuccinia psidii MF-1]|uniref:Uncharacterized protein n=1 Tax=Austropuccinia psidii MF-1 TaxID=1389203 RepID=A0A9Q3D306_9BASI|nr:hypothetical protein [Austropuccinia psidii MF-1]